MMAERVPIDTYCEKKIPTLQKTYDGLIDYVDISSVDNTEKKIISYQTIESNGAPSRAKQLLKKGDVLVSTVRPNLNAVAVVEEETENLMVGSTGYCVLRCKDNMDVRYLFNFCQSQYFVDDMSSQATGASYPAVSNGIVRSSLIPCCSIEEQREIAEKMDTVSELLVLRKQQLAELDELIKSRFIELFGDPNTNPMKWKKEPLQINATLLNGRAYKQDELLDNGKYPVLRVGNFFSNRGWYYSDLELDEDKYCDDGDLLYAWSASFGPRIWNGGKVIYHYHIWKVLVGEKYNKQFLCHLLDYATASFMGDTHGIGMMHLTKSGMEETEFIVPPIDLQNQFAAFVEQTEKSKMVVQRSIAELEEVKKSLMQKYFG